MARSRTPKAAATPVVEAQPVKLSWIDRMLLSDTGRKLAQPLTDEEKRTATSAVLTGAGMALVGPVAGAITAVGVTAIDSNTTKDNWRGVGSAACGGIAIAAAGAGAVASVIGGLATTAVGMIANRLRKE